MYRFLKWRYGGFRRTWTFESAIITHPDQDHYYGFRKLFDNPNVSFKSVYHNGIMEERTPGRDLGPFETEGSMKYLTGIIKDADDLQTFLNDSDRWRHPLNRRYDKRYPTLLHAASASGRVNDIRMLAASHDGAYLPDYGRGEDLQIRVLSPIVEPDTAGNARLRWFRKRPDGGGFDKGKTKNGHSIMLRLKYGEITILLGGDLNASAECFLLQHYAGMAVDYPWSAHGEEMIVEAARSTFASDIAKCCHHGSADFTDAFIKAINPAATVISSGDQESHAHPRSDTLGAIGLHGRGWRPLLFSTELARSTREHEESRQADVGALRARIESESDRERRQELRNELRALVDELLKRNVTVYGAINFRTDGRAAIAAYKLEKERRNRRSLTKWDIYQMEKQGNGPIAYREPE
jgi:hypothetical protein